MRWFRYWSEALNDPKVQLMPDRLFRHWMNLLCVVNELEPARGKGAGRLPKDIASVAYKLHMGVDEAQEVIDALIAWSLVDVKNGRWVMHGWEARQPVSDDVTPRVLKHREKQKRNVTETPPEGEGEERRSRGRKEGEGDAETRRTSSPRPPSQASSEDWDFARSLYERNLGPLDPRTRDDLKGLFDRVPDPRWVFAAINQATSSRQPGFGYVKNTLEDCLRKNQAPSTLAAAGAR